MSDTPFPSGTARSLAALAKTTQRPSALIERSPDNAFPVIAGLPAVTDTPATRPCGRSSSSNIVTTARSHPTSMGKPVGPNTPMLKLSLHSGTSSSRIGTEMVVLVSPGPNVTAPVVETKSVAAVPVALLVA